MAKWWECMTFATRLPVAVSGSSSVRETGVRTVTLWRTSRDFGN